MDILPGPSEIQYQPTGTTFLQPKTCTHEIVPLLPGTRARDLYHQLVTDDRNADDARHFGHILILSWSILMAGTKHIMELWRANIFINTTTSAVIVSPNDLRAKCIASLLDPDAEDWRGEPATPYHKPTIVKAASNYFNILSKTVLIPTDLLGYPNIRPGEK